MVNDGRLILAVLHHGGDDRCSNGAGSAMEIDRRKRLPSLMIYARFHAYERAA